MIFDPGLASKRDMRRLLLCALLALFGVTCFDGCSRRSDEPVTLPGKRRSPPRPGQQPPN